MHLRTHRYRHYATGITPQEAVNLMAPGWNLGNSFDAIPNETSWGNPTPSQSLIKAVGEYGGRSSGGNRAYPCREGTALWRLSARPYSI
jgi:hypothetical protein